MAPVREFIDFFLRNKGLGILLVLGLVAGIAGPTLFRGAILPTKRTDLTVYLRAGEAVLDNHAREIYSVANVRHWHYIYPPLLAILLAPVSKASPLATVPLAYLLSLACLAGTAVLSLRFPEDARPAPWQIALAMIFCLPMFLNTLTRGQFDIITLFLMAAIFYNHLKKKKLVTGLLLAFAVTLKVSPLAFLLFFFLMKREWKILWSALLGFVLFFFLLPSAAIGWNTNGALLKIWWGLMSISQSDTAYRHYLWNELYSPFGPHHQSIYSVVTRLAWPSETQFLGRSNRTVRIITSCLSALLLTLPFLKARGTAPGEKRSALKQLAEFSIFPMLMLFTSPVNHIHHYTVIYFLFLAALMLRDRIPRGSRARRGLDWSLWTCALSLTLGTMVPVLGHWGLPLWGALFLWGTVLFCPDPKGFAVPAGGTLTHHTTCPLSNDIIPLC